MIFTDRHGLQVGQGSSDSSGSGATQNGHDHRMDLGEPAQSAAVGNDAHVLLCSWGVFLSTWDAEGFTKSENVTLCAREITTVEGLWETCADTDAAVFHPLPFTVSRAHLSCVSSSLFHPQHNHDLTWWLWATELVCLHARLVSKQRDTMRRIID